MLVGLLVTAPVPFDWSEELGFLVLLKATSFILWVPLEAALLAFVGFTPGKFLFRVKVKRNGTKPDFPTALSRAALVTVFGLGCGVPGLQPVAMIIGFLQLYSGDTFWDRKAETEVICRDLGAIRAVFSAFVALSAFGGIAREILVLLEELWPGFEAGLP
jgi:hypothetical protein